MKKRQLYTLIISLMAIGFISCSTAKVPPSLKSQIMGSWELIEENGDLVTNRKQYKHYTDSRFSWHASNKQGIILTGAYGEYRIDGNELNEEIDLTMYGNNSFKGRTAKIKFEIRQDTMMQNIHIKMNNGDNIFTEKWVRVR